jgi:hypothetical protein
MNVKKHDVTFMKALRRESLRNKEKAAKNPMHRNDRDLIESVRGLSNVSGFGDDRDCPEDRLLSQSIADNDVQKRRVSSAVENFLSETRVDSETFSLSKMKEWVAVNQHEAYYVVVDEHIRKIDVEYNEIQDALSSCKELSKNVEANAEKAGNLAVLNVVRSSKKRKKSQERVLTRKDQLTQVADKVLGIVRPYQHAVPAAQCVSDLDFLLSQHDPEGGIVVDVFADVFANICALKIITRFGTAKAKGLFREKVLSPKQLCLIENNQWLQNWTNDPEWKPDFHFKL